MIQRTKKNTKIITIRYFQIYCVPYFLLYKLYTTHTYYKNFIHLK